MEIILNPSNTIDIPMIFGYNSNEGFMQLADCHKNKKYELYDKDLACRIPRSIDLDVNDPKCFELADEIRDYYFSGQTISDKMKGALAHFFGDYHFIIDLQLLAEIYARRQHKYVRYKFYCW